MTFSDLMSRRGALVELAGKTGFDAGYISRVARGHQKPSLDLLRSLSQATGIPMDALDVELRGKQRANIEAA